MEKQIYGMEEEGMNVSSDDDDSSDDGKQLRAEEIERELSSNVYLYDLHVELVNIFEETTDLTSLRMAYQRFAKIYPLTPAIWTKWINVEEKLASTAEERKTVRDLFEKATKDYLSIELWMKFVQFVMGQENLTQTNEILEQALSAGGLHFIDGSLLWDMLREIELACFNCIADKTSDEYRSQLSRVVEAFKRQLSVPLADLESTFAEFKDFISRLPEDHKIDEKSILSAYSAAAKQVEQLKPFEERLLMSQSDDELYDVYKDYINTVKDPSMAICLYERAIEKLCLQPQVWLDYITFSMKLGDVSLKISSRALRNVTWSEDLYCLRLKLLEKFQADASELVECFEQGLSMLPNTLNLWLDYIAYTRRNKATTLFKLLEQAELANVHDPTFKIARYQAKLYAQTSQLDKSREIWTAILSDASAKRTAHFWMEYINLERTHGIVPKARALFNRALTCNIDWPQSIADEWLMFERECGSLDEMFKCTEKINKILPDKLLRQVESATKRKLEDTPQNDTKQKRLKSNETKLPRNQSAPANLDHNKSVFISNISPFITKQQLSKMFLNGKVTLATNNKGQSRCFGYVEFESEEEATEALSRDREMVEGRPIFISKCKTHRQERQAAFKFAQHAEKNKLFVRGLPIASRREDVEQIFKPFACTDVRLVLHKSGQSKGLAYVEFSNEEDAEKARKATDNTKVGDFVISVAISAPPPKTRKEQDLLLINREQKPHARNRLQVPLVPRAALKNQINKDDCPSSSQNNVEKKSNNDFRKMFLG